MKQFINNSLNLFDKKTRKNLSDSDQSFFDRISRLVFQMAIISGCFGGITASQLLGYPFYVGFIVMFTISYLIEAFIASESGKNSRTWILRLTIGIVLAAIHALGIDAVIFKTDIENYYNTVQEAEIAELDSLYANRETTYYDQIDRLQQKIDSLNGVSSIWAERVFNEINSGGKNRGVGEGKFSRKWETLKGESDAKIAPQIAQRQSEIDTLHTNISTLKLEKQTKIDALVRPEDRGFIDRINALEVLILGKDGKWSMRAFYVFWFGIILYLECLVLQRKKKNEASYISLAKEKENERARNAALHKFGRTKAMEAEQAIIEQEERLRAEEALKQRKLIHQSRIEELDTHYRDRKLSRELDEFERREQSDNAVRFSRDGHIFDRWKDRRNGQHHPNGSTSA